MSTKKGSISRTITVGAITVKLTNRGNTQNNFTVQISHEDLPARLFPFRYYTDELIELLVKEAVAQQKHEKGKISSFDILKTLRASFELYRNPLAKKPMSLGKCKLAIRNIMNELAWNNKK